MHGASAEANGASVTTRHDRELGAARQPVRREETWFPGEGDPDAPRHRGVAKERTKGGIVGCRGRADLDASRLRQFASSSEPCHDSSPSG
jgi:hypothetical protein